MTDSRLLQKYTVSKPSPADEKPVGEAEGLDDLGICGVLRGVRERAIMLEFRQKDGNVHAFPYGWLTRATFDPSEGITLRFGSETVKIAGQNLATPIRPNMTLFDAIVRHRVPYIQEADGPTIISSHRQAIVVESITVKP